MFQNKITKPRIIKDINLNKSKMFNNQFNNQIIIQPKKLNNLSKMFNNQFNNQIPIQNLMKVL